MTKARKPGMSVGTEVAHIHVKVSPNTRNFRRELKEDLEAIERGANAPGKHTEVPVGADTKKLKSDVKSATKGLSADVDIVANKKSIDRFQRRMAGALQSNMSLLESKINLTQAGESFRRDVEKAATKLQRVINSPIPDDITAATERRQLIKEEVEALRQLANEDSNALAPKFNSAADFRFRKRIADLDRKIFEDRHKSQLALWKDELNHMKLREDETRKFIKEYNDKRPQLKIDLQADYRLKSNLNKLQEKLKKDNDKLFAVAGKGGGGGGLLSKLTPSFGSGINPAGYALILGGLLAVVAPLMGVLTTGLLAIPGLVGLITAPIAAITLGLEGFGKAAEKIKPQFENLQSVMSNAAESNFTPVFQYMADTIFPKLERALPSVTKGLADMATGALNAFNQDNRFEQSIGRIGTFLSSISPGINSFTSGFIGLIDQFTLKLPGISEWFNETGANFDAWVKKISADGSLSRAFEQLGAFIKKVLDLLGQFGSTSFDFMTKPGSLDGFLETLQKIGDVIDDIIALSAKLNENWQKVVQVGRFIGAAFGALQGNYDNRFISNLSDLLENKPWNGAKQAVDELNTSLGRTPEQIREADNRLKDMLGGGGSASGGSTATGPLDALQQTLATPPEPITPPDLEPVKTEITEYQGFVDQVTAQVRGSLEQATSGESLPAPNFEAFKAGWSSLPGFVTEQMSGVKNAAGNAVQSIADVFQIGGIQIVNAVAMWPGAIAQALAPLGEVGANVASQLVQGLVNGINAGIGSVTAAARNLAAQAKAAANAELGIKSPSREFFKIGEYSAQGMALGLESGFGPVIDQAKGLAAAVADAFEAGLDPSKSLAGYTEQDIKRIQKALALETKRLESQAKVYDYRASTTGDESWKERAKEIRMQKDQLGLQKSMIDLTSEYNDELGNSSSENPFAKAASGLMNAPVDFAKATGQQFLSDLGISGNGLISKAITEGINYVFNIGTVDEALSIKDREDSKQAMSVVGRA